MTELKATPGPLAIREGKSVVHVIDAYGRRIANFSTAEYWQQFNPEDLANAILYTAAPELYEALEQCVEALGTGMANALFKDGVIPGPAYNDALGAGMTALSKARGETE